MKASPPKSPEQLERIRHWLNPLPDEETPELQTADVSWLVGAYCSMVYRLKRVEEGERRLLAAQKALTDAGLR